MSSTKPKELSMRKLVLILSAVAAVGFTLPLAPTAAQAEKVVIKSGDHGHDRGWHRGHNKKVVVIKRGHHDGWRRHHAEGSKKVIIRRGHGEGSHKTVIRTGRD
jgi:arylamine N-acetyltransferase